jgi:hypothetical protein
VRAGHLGGHPGVDLLSDQGTLHGGEQVLGLPQPQAQAVEWQRFPLQVTHLAHHGLGAVIGVQHDPAR